MKTKHLLLSIGLLHLFLIFVGTALTSCQNPAKAVAISQLGLDILVAKNVLKPEEAAAAKAAGQILITPAAPVVEPSGK